MFLVGGSNSLLINRGSGSISRRRPREAKVEGPQKRQTIEVTSAYEAPVTGLEVQVDSPARHSTSVMRRTSPLNAAISSIGTALGSSSSMRQRIYEIFSAPSFRSNRVRKWIERKKVPLCAVVKAAIFRPILLLVNYTGRVGMRGKMNLSIHISLLTVAL